MKQKTALLLGLLFLTIGAIAAIIIIANYSAILHKAENYVSKNYLLKSFDEKLLSDYYLPEQYDLDVLHYTIQLDLFPEQKSIRGKITIKSLLKKASNEVYLNFYDNLEIEKVLLNNNSINFKRDKFHLKLFSSSLLKDTITIYIEYSGKPKSLGFGSFEFGEESGKSVIYTLNEPVFASTWLPCNDLPTDKAYTDLFITNDTPNVSVSNGILIDQSVNGSRKTFHWRTLYPISTYLIAIYSAPYKSFTDKFITENGKVLPLVYYVTPEKLKNAKIDFEEHPQYLNFFTKTFGEYPFIKEKYGVAEFLWNYGAMEHQTITGIGSKFITGKKFFSDMLVHELAHQWWGDAVTPKTWDDIWLNEGFATYSEALYWENYAGKDALISTMQSFSGNFDSGTLYHPFDNIFNRMVYDKGAWVLHMLRGEVGDSAFFHILKTYYYEYRYKNASTRDFEDVCEKISGKNLDYFFYQWIYKGVGIPNIVYKWGISSADSKYLIWVKISQIQKSFSIFKFPLVIRFYFDENNFNDEKFYITTRDTVVQFKAPQYVKNIRLNPENWLLAVIKQEKQK
ncbi:M1 family metallopeptidase [Melioribacteraceae bacterium 4301-Me]|uniref:M1 family metallopeptidase n=1 Tax=Pyranulibacter aquaticus TaxID=3163344 RepID=UPI00359563A4